MTWRVGGPLLAALILRLLAIGSCDRVVADVLRYEKVARHLLDVSWNPYQTKHLFPYAPPWAAVEAGAGWLARRELLPFAVAVKLPVLAADLAIVLLLARWKGGGRAAALAAWLYAVHPLPLLVGGVHGQFDAIPLLFVLLALGALSSGRRDASALALAAAIAVKPFPVLLLPILAFDRRASWRAAGRYGALALGLVALLLLPFALADPASLARELFGYSGVADFGWTGAWRAAEWWRSGTLARGEARFWPAAALASKLLFLGAWALLFAAVRRRRLPLEPERACLLVLLAFLSLYGLQSAQYLLWVVPLGCLAAGRHLAAYSLAASAGLVGFYLFLAPGTLLATTLPPAPALWAGRLWAAGAVGTLLASFAWLRVTWRVEGNGRRAATDAR